MPTNSLETELLLERASAGDPSGWKAITALYDDRLDRFLRMRLDRRLQSRLDVSDVMQEIYLEAWQHLPDYLETSSLPFYLWLRGVAGHKLLELHRHHLGTQKRDARREQRGKSPAVPDTTSAALVSLLIDSRSSPSRAAVRAEVRRQLHEALDQLGSSDREVLELRHFEQLSPAETAQVLGIHRKAAGMRYIRAMKRFGQLLDQLPGGRQTFLP